MSEIYHILNGDCLYNQLKLTSIQGNFIVFRECLIDGPVNSDTLYDFWHQRAAFISENYEATLDDYFHKMVSEFERILKIPEDSEIYLWFEHDLFCQANMWFIISVLAKLNHNQIYRVSPISNNEEKFWKGFSVSDIEMLVEAFHQKIAFQNQDIQLGCDLWEAYKRNDIQALINLSKQTSSCFYRLDDVCQAHIDRFDAYNNGGKPEKLVRQILKDGYMSFDDVKKAFFKVGGIYGFGDLQLRRIYDNETNMSRNI